MQGRRRIIRQQSLEITKGKRAVIEILRLLNDIKAGRIFNKYVGSPVIAVLVHQVIISVNRADYVQCFPIRISAILDNFISEEGGYIHDVLHQLPGLFKNFMIHALQNVPFCPAVIKRTGQTDRIINMTASIRNRFGQGSFNPEHRRNFLLNYLHIQFIHFHSYLRAVTRMRL